MEKLILIGGGGHCLSCIDVIHLEDKYKIIGIVDKNQKLNKNIKYKIIGNDKHLFDLIKKYKNALITVGQIKNNITRLKLYKKLKNFGASLPFIVSPKAYLGKNTNVGEGSIIMHNVILNIASTVKKNCIINTGTILEHEVIVNSHCHISTGVIINGGSRIGEGTFIGSGSVIHENIIIDENCVIPAGSIIKKNVTNHKKTVKS